jgi:hypothetical protein
VPAVCRASCNRPSPEPSFVEQGFPVVVVGFRVEWAAVRLGEHPSFVVPELADCTAALGFLMFPVSAQQPD